MPLTFLTEDIATAVLTKARPGITVWNRLEGRPRTAVFDRALRAEVRDALWMLTRQWQMGEFVGDDAGSPISVKVRLETTKLDKYQPADGAVEPFDDVTPLEARVERMPVRLTHRVDPTNPPHDLALDIRLLLGRQWLKMIRSVNSAPTVAAEFLAEYPVHSPDPTDPLDALTCAHPEAWSNFAAAGGRRMDGAALLAHLTGAPGNHAYDGIPSLVGMEAATDAVAARFLAWYERLIYQPAEAGAWLPERLEYRFAAAAPTDDAGGEKVYTADQYFHGHLDWYSFDVDPTRDVLGEPNPAPEAPTRTSITTLATQATFSGMPNTRWWRFEDGRTNFGDVKPDTTDLAKLLLIEFGLVYANDWFVVPHTLAVDSIATVKGLAVTNTFGERTWVGAAGAGLDDDWQRWAMFHNSIVGTGRQPADLSLMVPPAAQQVLEGRPLEEVMLARDEMANMVWGVERVIPLPSGETKRGREAALETRALFERLLADEVGGPPQPLPPAPGAKIRYQVMSSVPEDWIPFIPVHVDGDNREVQLRRAAMLRIMVGDPDDTPNPVRPRTSLLRPGLEDVPATGYQVHEEEVPRAGALVTQSFQRTRWRGGRTVVWLGVRKRTGRGEGSSGLAFDRLVDIPPAS